MTPDEARAHLAAQNARLAHLIDEVGRLAAAHSTPVLLSMIRMLVEMVCQRDGAAFRVLYMTRFYEGVLRLLREKGIS